VVLYRLGQDRQIKEIHHSHREVRSALRGRPLDGVW